MGLPSFPMSRWDDLAAEHGLRWTIEHSGFQTVAYGQLVSMLTRFSPGIQTTACPTAAGAKPNHNSRRPVSTMLITVHNLPSLVSYISVEAQDAKDGSDYIGNEGGETV